MSHGGVVEMLVGVGRPPSQQSSMSACLCVGNDSAEAMQKPPVGGGGVVVGIRNAFIISDS